MTARTIAASSGSVVDLQAVERKAFEVAQAGIAGAEVIHRQTDAQRFEPTQQNLGLIGILHDHRFGQFKLQPLRVKLGILQCLGHNLDDVVLPALARRKIDRDRQPRHPLTLPERGLSTGLAQHPFAKRQDDSGFLGQRDELYRSAFG